MRDFLLVSHVARCVLYLNAPVFLPQFVCLQPAPLLVATYQQQVEPELREYLSEAVPDALREACNDDPAIAVFFLEGGAVKFSLVGEMRGKPFPRAPIFVKPTAGLVGERCHASEEK